MIGPLEQALLALLLVVLMVGMGATLTLDSFREVLRRPKGVLIGVASQFGWMPLVAFGLARLFDLDPNLALGLIIVGATPGGTTSNLFSYYSRADVALSISMTVTSTVVAVVAMPLLVGAYAGGLSFSVPVGKIATTLALVLVPVVIGMVIRHRSLTAARRAERLGSISGVVVLVVLVASSLWRNHTLFSTIPLGGYLSAIGLGLGGMILGYLAALALRLSVSERRAIAFETGIQNSPLAFAIVFATLPEDAVDEAIRLPMLYALFVLITASLVTLAFRARAVKQDP
ncbi:MAG: bile acid:sodium symporter [Myxococcota bacterium]